MGNVTAVCTLWRRKPTNQIFKIYQWWHAYMWNKGVWLHIYNKEKLLFTEICSDIPGEECREEEEVQVQAIVAIGFLQ